MRKDFPRWNHAATILPVEQQSGEEAKPKISSLLFPASGTKRCFFALGLALLGLDDALRSCLSLGSLRVEELRQRLDISAGCGEVDGSGGSLPLRALSSAFCGVTLVSPKENNKSFGWQEWLTVV